MAQPSISIDKFNFEASSLKNEWERFSTQFSSYFIINSLEEESDKVKINFLTLVMGYHKSLTTVINKIRIFYVNQKQFNKISSNKISVNHVEKV